MDSMIVDANREIKKSSCHNDDVDPISKITDQLFLCQGRVTAFADILSKLGITHIVSVGRSPHDSVRTGAFYKLEIQHVLDLETENLSTHFPTIFRFMRNAINDGGKICVHCEMGCSRSAAVMIAFLRADGYMDSLQSAYDHVKSRRRWINPNIGFKHQLQQFFCEKLV